MDGIDYKNEWEPDLRFCNHPNNLNVCEGNCNRIDCPFKLI